MTVAIFKKLVQILAILFLSFLLTELVLRIFFTFSPKVRYFLYSSRYDLDFSKIETPEDLVKNNPCPLRPLTNINGFIINNKGFYTPEYQIEKPQNAFRIGFIGDSFLIGVVPYPQNFVNLFSEKVQKIFKEKKVEVINWGLPCLGPQFEEKIVEIEALPAKPDVLIWLFFVGNDFTDELVPGEKLPFPNLLVKNIYTLRLTRNLQKSLLGLRLKREVPTGEKTYSQEEKPTFSWAQFLRIQAEKLSLLSPPSFPFHSWQEIQKILLRFKQNCEINKTECLLVIIPDENQVDESLLEEVLKFQGVTHKDLVLDYPQKLMNDFFEKNNFYYLDLLPAFMKMGKEKRLYRPQDTHWNIAGNQLAAETIFGYLEDNLLAR